MVPLSYRSSGSLFFRKFAFATSAVRGALEMVDGDVVTLTMDDPRRFLARVRCQDRHQGHGGRN